MVAHGAELIGEMKYGDSYRLAYIRGPEGIIAGLAEQLGRLKSASSEERQIESTQAIDSRLSPYQVPRSRP